MSRPQPTLARGVARTLVGWTIALATLAIAVAPAVAQEASNAPRQPAVRNFPSAWVGYAAMFFIMALVVGVSLYPSKRGHQE